MCKYCKRLKELNELDKRSLQNSIDDWKRRDLEARKLIKELLAETYPVKPYSYTHVFLMARIERFLSCNWIGK